MRRVLPGIVIAALIAVAHADVPPIYQGVYNQCRTDCMENISSGAQRGGPDAKATFDERTGFCRFVCACTIERLNPQAVADASRGDVAKVIEAERGCIAQWTPPATVDTKLRRQEVLRAASLYSFSLAERHDRRAVYAHLQKFDGRALSCAYGDVGVSYWYQTVPISAAELKAIASSHPLLMLGTKAVSECPATLGAAMKKREEVGGFFKAPGS